MKKDKSPKENKRGFREKVRKRIDKRVDFLYNDIVKNGRYSEECPKKKENVS